MQSPIKLSDEELDAVMRAAAPLDRDQRDPFLQAVAAELARCKLVGDGTVFRVCREVQRKFYRPPLDDHGRQGVSKYARI